MCRFKIVSACVATVLIVVLMAPLAAQTRPDSQPRPAGITAMVPSLKVLILQGADVTNNIKAGMVTVPVVEVRDENDRPVEGAEVVFRLPAVGPGGIFPDHRPTYRTRTNSQGQAASARYVLSSQPGTFQIQVTATYENRVGQAVVEQTNSTEKFLTEAPKARRISKKKLILIGAAGGGVATALILALGGSSPPVYSVSPGPITVGPPR